MALGGSFMKEQYHLQIDRTRKVFFSLPDDWACAHFVCAKENDRTAPSVEQMLRDALIHLDDVPQLRNAGSPLQTVAIIVDDLTRPTPVPDILGVLLPYLDESG